MDGCTASFTGTGGVVDVDPDVLFDGPPGSGLLVWVRGDPVEIEGDAVTAISPDGSAAIVTTRSSTSLIELTDGTPVPIADDAVVVHFADR